LFFLNFWNKICEKFQISYSISFKFLIEKTKIFYQKLLIIKLKKNKKCLMSLNSSKIAELFIKYVIIYWKCKEMYKSSKHFMYYHGDSFLSSTKIKNKVHFVIRFSYFHSPKFWCIKKSIWFFHFFVTEYKIDTIFY